MIIRWKFWLLTVPIRIDCAILRESPIDGMNNYRPTAQHNHLVSCQRLLIFLTRSPIYVWRIISVSIFYDTFIAIIIHAVTENKEHILHARCMLGKLKVTSHSTMCNYGRTKRTC